MIFPTQQNPAGLCRGMLWPSCIWPTLVEMTHQQGSLPRAGLIYKMWSLHSPQKEIEALQARMSVLEAKDQQLRREIEARERVLLWRGCDLAPLMGRLPLDELREVSEALHDTLALASQIPLHAGPPEALTRYWGFLTCFLSLSSLTGLWA